MIPVSLSGSLAQPVAVFGVDVSKPEKACVSGLDIYDPSDSTQSVWVIRHRGGGCADLSQITYGVAPRGFETTTPPKPLKAGVRYNVWGSGLTGGLFARVPWRGGGDFLFEDGRWQAVTTAPQSPVDRPSP
jgi:hypothetical protein